MARLPTDAEIQRTAERLTADGATDLLDEHGGVLATKRGKVAKALQLAADETARTARVAAASEPFAAQIARYERDLLAQNVTPETAARVIGAIAPQLWRDMKEKEATAHGNKTRTQDHRQ